MACWSQAPGADRMQQTSTGERAAWRSETDARVRVIGRRLDLVARAAWRQGDVLDVPDEQWSESLNVAWIHEGVAARQVFRVLSPPSPENLWHSLGSTRRKTVFALELELLAAAGYSQVGEWWFPPDRQAEGR